MIYGGNYMNFSTLKTNELSFYLGNMKEKDNKFYFINQNEEGQFPILEIGKLFTNILNYDFHIWANIIRNSEDQEPNEYIHTIIKATKEKYDEVFSILLNNLVINLLKQLSKSNNYETFFSKLYQDMKIDNLYKKHYGNYPTNQSSIKEIFYGFVPYVGTHLNLYKAFLKSFFEEGKNNNINIQMFPNSLSMGYKILPKIDIQGKTHYFQEFFTVDNLLDLSMFEVLKIQERNICIQKCENCNNYFIAKSKQNKYCDNIVLDTGKTCKELSREKAYNKKVRTKGA